EILRIRPHLTFREGPYSYRIDTTAGRAVFTVTDGTKTISEPVKWAFGLGVAGQTYLFTHDGRYIEGRVSYYSENKGLDVTVGHPQDVPRSIEDALGRWVGVDEARACFGCHTTRAVTATSLDVDRAVPGVTCEACHGPGGEHIASMKAGNLKQEHIFNPGALNTEDLSNFCGACHRTWEQVGMMGLRGVGNVRFQPYRLTNSKCYDTDDKRISCVACHDPHEDVKREPSFYDSKCTACHTQKQKSGTEATRAAVICPVAKEKCTTCHMPKYDLPGGHYTFTDHDIRIVRPGDPYPN
ncbi:MAG: multiheme c-type cytochrome, partial [Blastocatellia bacterium]